MSLIERESLQEAVEASLHDNPHTDKKVYANHIYEHQHMLRLIGLAPTIDAAPVVHGEWIKRDGYTECSKCEYWYDSPESEDTGDRSNYCPNCGARMDGGEGHEAG